MNRFVSCVAIICMLMNCTLAFAVPSGEVFSEDITISNDLLEMDSIEDITDRELEIIEETPTPEPTAEPTDEPTDAPIPPTDMPTEAPSDMPTALPTDAPIDLPTQTPDPIVPTLEPDITPDPSDEPIETPSPTPTLTPEPSPTADILYEKGDRGDGVKAVQSKLRVLGLLTDSADGIFGSNTETGVSRGQDYLTLLSNAGKLETEYTRVEDGAVDSLFYQLLLSDELPLYSRTLSKGDSGSEVTRLQRRLYMLNYLESEDIDGDFGSTTRAAVASFQSRNGVTVGGNAGPNTLAALYSSSAKSAPKPDISEYSRYKLIVDVGDQRVYVYGYANGGYNDKLFTFKCSTGKRATPTPLGTFTGTERIDRWHYFTQYKVWAQYAYRIKGSYYFHSVLFKEKGGSPTSSSVNALGSRASHGCVRLSVSNSKWIYENCRAGTVVVVRS